MGWGLGWGVGCAGREATRVHGGGGGGIAAGGGGVAAVSWQWHECGGCRRPAEGGRRVGGGAQVAVACFRQVPHDLYLHLENLLRARVRGAALRRLLRSRFRHRLDRDHLAGAPLASKVHRAKPAHTDRVIQVDGVVGQHVKRRVGLVYLLRIGPGVRVAIIRHRARCGAPLRNRGARLPTKEGRFSGNLQRGQLQRRTVDSRFKKAKC